jgi:hypothetical protein
MSFLVVFEILSGSPNVDHLFSKFKARCHGEHVEPCARAFARYPSTGSG